MDLIMAHCSPQLAYYDCKKLRKEIYFCNSFFKYDLFPSYQNVMKKKIQKYSGQKYFHQYYITITQTETYKTHIISSDWYSITSRVFLPYKNIL